MSERILLDVTDGVAHVRLNRPDKLNALDGALFQAIVDTGEALKEDRSVRVVVLSGEGRGFCAGLDFGSFQAMAQGPAAPPEAADQEGSGGGSGSLGALLWVVVCRSHWGPTSGSWPPTPSSRSSSRAGA
jgi:enoyl-CoA hydratase/carnithine racemase